MSPVFQIVMPFAVGFACRDPALYAIGLGIAFGWAGWGF